MSDTGENTELDILFPEREVTVNGEKITIKPFMFGQLARVARHVKPIIDSMISSGILHVARSTSSPDQVDIQMVDDFIPKLFDLLDHSGEALMNLIAFAINKPREWLDGVPPDEGIELAERLWKVNADFFVKRVMPKIAGKVNIASPSAGATSSPGSSQPTTDERTLTATH